MRHPSSISTSVRRHFVDSFFFSHEEIYKPGVKILDIGGKKKNKRGLFNLGKYSAEVKYVNIDRSTDPDIVADATAIPLPQDSTDIVILGEILEHVPNPIAVLKEAYRLLKPGGNALVTVPFMIGVHADPHDYARYTPTFLENAAIESGFREVKIKAQGTIFSVMAHMIQQIFLAKKRSWRPIQFPLIRFLMWLDRRTTSPLLSAWTTGYGIVLTK